MTNGLFTITEIFNRVERLEELINGGVSLETIETEINEISEDVIQLQADVEILKNNVIGGSGGSGTGTGVIEW